MPDIRYLRPMVNGAPVVAAPAGTDVTTTDELRTVLLAATVPGHPVVVDMTRTRLRDSRGRHSLLGAHKRLRSDGGELRLVIPAGSGAFRIFTLAGLDKFISRFGSLHEALLQQPADAIAPSGPALVSPVDLSGSPDRGG